MPTPIDFRKLFKDTSKYPDSLKIKIGDDSELELGVLRAWNNDNEGALVSELESQRRALTAEADKIDKARREVATQYLDVMELKSKYEGKTPPDKRQDPTDPYDGLTDDPIAGKLAQLVKSQSAQYDVQLKAIREDNKKLLDAIGKMGVTYMNDRAGQDYATLASDPDFDAKDESLSQQKLYEAAVRNGHRDAAGIPDIRKAYREATSDKRVARLVKEAREDERKKVGEETRHQAMLPRPSGPRPAGAEAPQYKNLDGALTAALEDKAIWNAAGEA